MSSLRNEKVVETIVVHNGVQSSRSIVSGSVEAISDAGYNVEAEGKYDTEGRTFVLTFKISASVDGGMTREDFLRVAGEMADALANVNLCAMPIEKKDELSPLFDRLDRTIRDIQFSVRTENCLSYAGIEYVGDLVQKKEVDLLKIENFLRKCLKEVKEVLAEMGLGLSMNDLGWTRPTQSK